MANAKQIDFLLAGLLGSDGKALSSGKVYTYAAGTSWPQVCYTAADKSAEAANPIILDAYGQATVYGDGNYKFIIKDRNDITVATIDNLSYSISSDTNKTITTVSADYTVSTSDQIIKVNTASGNITINLQTAVGNSGRELVIIKSSSDANSVIITPYGSETIVGAATYELANPYDATIIVSDGAGWQVESQANNGTVTLTAIQTLTNKTLTDPVIPRFYQDAGKTHLLTAPALTGTLATIDAAQSMTNKDLTDSSNTIPASKGNMSNVDISFASTSTITIKALCVEINGIDYYLAATLTKTVAALTASTWYYIFAEAPGSGYVLADAQITYSSTAPAYDETKDGWYDTTGNLKCIGCFYSNGSSEVAQFSQVRGLFRLEQPISFLSTASPATSWTAVSVGGPAFGAMNVYVYGACQSNLSSSQRAGYIRGYGSTSTSAFSLTGLGSSNSAADWTYFPSYNMGILSRPLRTNANRQLEYYVATGYSITSFEYFLTGFELPGGF